jgi:hypothetical protein
MVKKIAVIFLLSCLIAPYVAKYLSLDLLKNRLRKEVKHYLARNTDPENLVTLCISHHDAKHKLTWIHAGEFEFNGIMYDIVHAEHTRDGMTYVCWPDHKETSLNKQLAGLLAMAVSGSPTQRQNRQQWESFSKSFVFVLPDSLRFSPYGDEYNKFYSPFEESYPMVFIHPPTPPPELHHLSEL